MTGVCIEWCLLEGKKDIYWAAVMCLFLFFRILAHFDVFYLAHCGWLPLKVKFCSDCVGGKTISLPLA